MAEPPQNHVRDIVTPEAVLLDLTTAGVGTRTMAALIDIVVRMVATFLLAVAGNVLQDVTGPFPAWAGVSFLIVIGFVVTYGYGVLFEAFMGGRTPGKAAMGIRVVTTSGGPIGFREAAIRGALGVVEIMLTAGLVAFVAVFATERDQRIGDLVAGTLVVRERSAAKVPAARTFVPPLAAQEYASGLDVTLLTGEDYLLARSYFDRAHSLQPEARSALAGQVASRMVHRLGTIPPVGMPPDIFLLCVVAAYQRRYAPR